MTTPYVTGTVSVIAGSAVVTGNGTGWDTSGLVAGVLGVNGIAVPVASIDSDTQITLALEWPGASASGQEYWITYDTEPGQQTVANAQRLAEYIARLNNPALAAAAGVTPSANKVLLFTGTNTATLIDLEDIIQGVKFDAEVPNLAGRAAYDSQPKGYRVLVANVGDGRSAFYTKLSNASADWSVPFYITGVAGPAGVTNPRGSYAAGTAYAKNDMVLDNGSSWIAKVATTGNAPPTLPTTSNTWWQLAAAKGTDGTGTGDVVGPNGGVTAGEYAVFLDNTGKRIGRATNPPGGQNDAIFALEIADLKGQRLGMKGGVSDAFDDETGVNVKTNAVYDATNDWYTPSRNGGGQSGATSIAPGTALFTLVDRSLILVNGSSLSTIGVYSTTARSTTIKVVRRVSGTVYDVLNSFTFSHPGGGWYDYALPSPLLVPSGTIHLGAVFQGSGNDVASGVARAFIAGDAAVANGVSGWGEDSSTVIPIRYSYQTSDMTLRSVAYVAASQPATGRLAVQLIETDGITINTDVIGRVSRDNGTTWATAVLSLSQSLIGPKIYEATGISLASLGAGTSMRWEISTVNSKYVAVSGVVMQWS